MTQHTYSKNIETRARELYDAHMRQAGNARPWDSCGFKSYWLGLAEREAASPAQFTIGGKYNWKGQPDRLIYLGRNWSGNGFWHQFKKIGDPRAVWCEVLDSELHLLEETVDEAQ